MKPKGIPWEDGALGPKRPAGKYEGSESQGEASGKGDRADLKHAVVLGMGRLGAGLWLSLNIPASRQVFLAHLTGCCFLSWSPVYHCYSKITGGFLVCESAVPARL